MSVDTIREPAGIPGLTSFWWGGKRTILIAGGDANRREELAKEIRSAGYHVLEAEDGEGTLEQIRSKDPEILVCCRDLPGVGGLQLCRKLKEDPATRETFIIMVSAEIDPDQVAAGLDAGADEYIHISSGITEILARIRVGFRFVSLKKALARRNEEFLQLTTRVNQELQVIADIQRALLPQKLPRMPCFEFTDFYLPSTECGGDYYDLVRLDDHHYGFVVADVSGHGAPAMVAMALVRQDFHLISRNYREPHLLLEELNRLLFDNLPTEQYATMHYAILNTKTFTCDYSSAGHPPPFWYRGDRRQLVHLENCQGFPLKLVTRDATYTSQRIELELRDKLIYYTDGIPECFNSKREVYGMARLEESIEKNADGLRSAQLKMEIVTDVMRFADDHPQEDDLTLAILGALDHCKR